MQDFDKRRNSGQSILYFSRDDSDLYSKKNESATSGQVTFIWVRAFSEQPSFKVSSELPGSARVVVLRQASSVPADDYQALSSKILSGVSDGFYGYLANTVVDPAWAWATAQWMTTDPARFGSFARAVGTLQGAAGESLLGDPIGMIGSSLGLPDPSLLEGIGSQIPIPGLDTTLGEIKLFFEVAGVIIGVLTANPVLACACSKLLVHDGLHRLAVAMMRDVAHDFNSTPPDQRKLMTRESQSSSLDILVRSAEPRLTFDAGSNAMTGPSTWVTDPAAARRTQPARTQSAGGTPTRSGGPDPAAARRTQPARTQSAGGTPTRSGGPDPAAARRTQPARTQSAGGTPTRSGGPDPAAARRTQPARTQSAGVPPPGPAAPTPPLPEGPSPPELSPPAVPPPGPAAPTPPLPEGHV